jgi:hypothetical protein
MQDANEHERRIVREEVVQTPAGAGATVVDQRTRIEPTPAERALGNLRRWQQVVWLLFGILVGLIAIRFVLVALGANMTLGFGLLVYGVTQPFDVPFLVLFGDQSKALGRGPAVELGSLVAIVVYLLVGWVINKVLEIIMAPKTPAR